VLLPEPIEQLRQLPWGDALFSVELLCLHPSIPSSLTNTCFSISTIRSPSRRSNPYSPASRSLLSALGDRIQLLRRVAAAHREGSLRTLVECWLDTSARCACGANHFRASMYSDFFLYASPN
jgi:hypothetical protein